MLSLAADEDLDWDILRGLRRRLAQLDIVTVREAGLSGADDPAVLDWAAQCGRVLLSHDVNTMTKHTIESISAGLECPGVIFITRGSPTGVVIDDLALLLECCDASDFEKQVLYVPLR